MFCNLNSLKDTHWMLCEIIYHKADFINIGVYIVWYENLIFNNYNAEKHAWGNLKLV